MSSPTRNSSFIVHETCVKNMERGELFSLIVHVLTDGKFNSHKEYRRYMQACSTMQSKYFYSKSVLYELDYAECKYYFPHKHKRSYSYVVIYWRHCICSIVKINYT